MNSKKKITQPERVLGEGENEVVLEDLEEKKLHVLPKERGEEIPKTKKKGQGKGGGRPRADIRLYFAKILPYLQRGLSVVESCKHAGIPYQTVYDYMASDEKFSEEIAVAQQTIEIASRNNVAREVEKGNLQASQWYLERKRKDEFSARVENINPTPEMSDVLIVNLPANGREVILAEKALKVIQKKSKKK